ncbi:MAG: VOC family protein [Burkholderiales bacterium]
MNHGLIEIDHLLTSVREPDEAGETFQRMGFTVTPRSGVESMGIANRLVLMTPLQDGTANFIELMGLTEPARAHPGMKALLAGPEGIRSMVMATLDAHASVDELRKGGYDAEPAVALQRKWRLPDGSILDVAFDVIMPIPAPLLFNACRYRTREHYVRPDWLTHRNGAMRMTAVLCCTEDVMSVARYYSRLFGRPEEPIEAGGRAIRPANVSLEIHEADGLERRFPGASPRGRRTGYLGYRIAVAGLAHLRACLDAGGVSYAEVDGAVTVPASEAHGNVIVFHQGHRA